MFEDLEDDFIDDDFSDDFDDFDEEGEASEDEGNNNFMLIAGGLGAVVVLGIICILVFYGLQNRSGGNAASIEATNAVVIQTSTAISLSAAETSTASSWTSTPTETPLPTDTPEPTATQVILPTDTPDNAGEAAATEDPRTATVAALLTAAATQPTADVAATSITPVITAISTELPDTGFADDVGLPGLIALAFFALIIIFLVRRMRVANA